MNNELTIQQQLLMLKDLTNRFDQVHEVQSLQLRNYHLLIPGSTKAEVRIDTNRRLVEYHVKAKKATKSGSLLKKIYAAIDKYTKFILWDNTSVVIFVNGDLKYDSRTEK